MNGFTFFKTSKGKVYGVKNSLLSSGYRLEKETSIASDEDLYEVLRAFKIEPELIEPEPIIEPEPMPEPTPEPVVPEPEPEPEPVRLNLRQFLEKRRSNA